MPPHDCTRFDVAISGAGLAGALSRFVSLAEVQEWRCWTRDLSSRQDLWRVPQPSVGMYSIASSLPRDRNTGSTQSIEFASRPRLAASWIVEIPSRDGRPGLGLSRDLLDDSSSTRPRGRSRVVRARCAWSARSYETVASWDEWPHPVQAQSNWRAKVTIAADGRNSSLVRQTGQTRQLDRLRPRLVGLKRHMTIDDPDCWDRQGRSVPRRTRWLRWRVSIEGGLTNLCGWCRNRRLCRPSRRP